MYEHEITLRNISNFCNELINDIVKEEPLTKELYESNIISEWDNFIILNKYDEIKPRKMIIPTNKELRLALDMVNQQYPLYRKSDIKTKVNFIKDIFKYDINEQRLKKLKPFKKINKESRSISVNGKIVLKTIIRKRNRNNKNNI